MGFRFSDLLAEHSGLLHKIEENLGPVLHRLGDEVDESVLIKTVLDGVTTTGSYDGVLKALKLNAMTIFKDTNKAMAFGWFLDFLIAHDGAPS